MSLRQSNFPVVYDTQGEQTNPTTATVLADTGQLGNSIASPMSGTALITGGGGIYEVLVVINSEVASVTEYVVQRRNAANGANVGDVPILYCPASSIHSELLRFEAESGERFRVLPNANITGDVTVTIQAQRVG